STTSPRRQPSTPLFPYTTLFRSTNPHGGACSAVFFLELCHACATRSSCSSPRSPSPAVTTKKASPAARPASATTPATTTATASRSEEHTSELQSRENLVCRLLLE